LIAHLRQAGILAVFHYVPLHSSPYGESLGGRPGTLPVTEEMSERLLRLPFYYDMSEADVVSVAEAIFHFYEVRAPQ
jgi:dTDP-4-amino-4,6-dideoxygalactose transaminase